MNINKIFTAICLLAASAAIVGCEESLDTYEGESGIYFDTKADDNSVMLTDTVTVHWGLKNADITSQTVKLRVKLFGNTASVDRKFSILVETDPGDTYAAEAGIDYIEPPLEYTMKAGEAETVIEVEVLRRHNLQDNPRRLRISLVETPELKFLFSRAVGYVNEAGETLSRPLDLQRVIYMDESFPIPGWWYYCGDAYFGDWSMTKSALICEVMGIDREDWVDTNALVNSLSQGYLKFCGRYMQKWLEEQAAQGNTILDEDGSPMVMGPDSQI